ncbi:hypothetical protein WR25_00907 [Diploscapter pachys]|uniref:GLTSCR protein conserved domain-containing protein n=1 Tax=Diploscapter pachys TaxID=2018661 RepID=A0A2A2KVR2_9BILA|nr:hypothetical protein WR25_00907 [Diploscapter pachys]
MENDLKTEQPLLAKAGICKYNLYVFREEDEWFTSPYTYEEPNSKCSPLEAGCSSAGQHNEGASLQIPMREPSPASPSRDLCGDLQFDSSLSVPLNDYHQFANDAPRLTPPASSASYEQMTTVGNASYETVTSIPQTTESYNSFEQPTMMVVNGDMQFTQQIEDSMNVFQTSSSMSQQPSCSIAQQQQQEMFITSNTVSMEGTSTQQIVEIVQPFDQNQMQLQPSYHQQMQSMEHKPNTIYDDGHFIQSQQMGLAHGIITVPSNRGRQTQPKTVNGRKKPAPKGRNQPMAPPPSIPQPMSMQGQGSGQPSKKMEVRMSSENSAKMQYLFSEIARLQTEEKTLNMNNSARITALQNEVTTILLDKPIQSQLDNEIVAQIKQVAQQPPARSMPPAPRNRQSHQTVLQRQTQQYILQQQSPQQPQQQIVYNNSPQSQQLQHQPQSPYQHQQHQHQQQQKFQVQSHVHNQPPPQAIMQQQSPGSFAPGSAMKGAAYISRVEYVPTTSQQQQQFQQVQHAQQQQQQQHHNVIISDSMDIKPQIITYRNSGPPSTSSHAYQQQQQSMPPQAVSSASHSQLMSGSVPVGLQPVSVQSFSSSTPTTIVIQHSSAQPISFPAHHQQHQQQQHQQQGSISISQSPLTIIDGQTIAVPPGTETVGDFIRQTTLGNVIGGRRLQHQNSRRSQSKTAQAAQKLLAAAQAGQIPVQGPVPPPELHQQQQQQQPPFQLPVKTTPPPAQPPFVPISSNNIPGPSVSQMPPPIQSQPPPQQSKVILLPRNTATQTQRRIMERRAVRHLRIKDYLDELYPSISQPETERPFTDMRDMLERLLPYHLFYEPELKPEILEDFDANLLRMEINNQICYDRVRHKLASVYMNEAMKESGMYEDNLLLFLDGEYERRALNKMKRDAGDPDVPQKDAVPQKYSQYEYNHDEFDYNDAKSPTPPPSEVSASPQPSSPSLRSPLSSPISGRRSVHQLSSPSVKSPTPLPISAPVLSPVRLQKKNTTDTITLIKAESISKPLDIPSTQPLPEIVSLSALSASSLCSPTPSTSAAAEPPAVTKTKGKREKSEKKEKKTDSASSAAASSRPSLRISLPPVKLPTPSAVLTASKNGNAKSSLQVESQDLDFSADESEEEEGPASPELGLDSDIPVTPTPTMSKSISLSSPVSNKNPSTKSLNHLTVEEGRKQKENLGSAISDEIQPPPIKLKLKLGMPPPAEMNDSNEPEERIRKHHKKKKKKKHKKEKKRDAEAGSGDERRRKKEKRRHAEEKQKHDDEKALITNEGRKIKLRFKGVGGAGAEAALVEDPPDKEVPAKIPKLKIKFGFGSGSNASKAEEKEVSKEQKGRGVVLLNGRPSDASHEKETETEALTNGGLDRHAEESHSVTLLRPPTKPAPATSVEFSDSSDSETEKEKLRSATEEALRDCGLTGAFGMRQQPGTSSLLSNWPKTQQAP